MFRFFNQTTLSFNIFFTVYRILQIDTQRAQKFFKFVLPSSTYNSPNVFEILALNIGQALLKLKFLSEYSYFFLLDYPNTQRVFKRKKVIGQNNLAALF